MDAAHAQTSKQRIAIMGHVGNGNLGDEAIVAAVVARLRARAPGIDLAAFTANPPDTTARHGIPAFPIRLMAERRGHASGAASAPAWGSRVADRVRRLPWLKAMLRPVVLVARGVKRIVTELLFDLRSFRRLRGVKLVVFAGSGQLNDDMDGPYGYPLVILRWSLLARLRGATLSFASVGAGPIDRAISRRFIRLALRLATYRSFRDDSSLALVRRLGTPEPNLLVRDLALSHPRLAPVARPPRAPGARCAGINPLPFYGGGYWQVQDQSVYDGYVKAHADLVVGLTGRGWRVVLFPTQIRVDPETIRDIVRQLRTVATGQDHAVEAATDLTDVSSLFDTLDGIDVVVATRYHGVLLALASGIPTVAVSYHPKTRDIMEHMGLGSWCLDVEGLTGPMLLDRVEGLVSQLEAVRATLADRRGRDLEELLTQYDELLRLAGVVAPTGSR
jgi:polysaccharide pyruvyl transferase WcaK-like protein